MVIYIYISLLAFGIIALYFGVANIKKYPIRIRIIISFVFVGLFFRYVTLIILFLIKGIKYLYLLKVFYFLYLLCIPLGAMISIFILTRSSIFKFNHIIGSAVILIAVYSIIMYKCPVNITMDNNILLGYIMNFSKECWYVDWSYMLANIITLLVAITQLGNNNIYASGIYIVIIASLLSIAECVMWSINLVIFPQYLFGEITWIMAMLYSLIKVSRK